MSQILHLGKSKIISEYVNYFSLKNQINNVYNNLTASFKPNKTMVYVNDRRI